MIYDKLHWCYASPVVQLFPHNPPLGNAIVELSVSPDYRSNINVFSTFLVNDSLDGMRISYTKRDDWSRQPVAKESASSDIMLEFSYFTTVKIVTVEIYASVLGTSRHRGKQRACGNDGAVTFGRKKVEVVVPLLDILRNYLVLGILTCFFVTAARIYGYGRGQLRFSVLT